MVLAFCLLWLTIFISWLLYYFISIARDISNLVGQARGVVDRVDGLTKALHGKIETGAASFSLMAQAAKEIVTWVIKEKTKKAPAKRKKKSEE